MAVSPTNDALVDALTAAVGGVRHGELVMTAYDGVDLVCRLEFSPSERGEQRWLRVESKLSPDCPLFVELRPNLDVWRRTAFAHGNRTATRDVAFDARYLMEAAPHEIVERVFDAGARAFLLGYDVFELRTHTYDGPHLSLQVAGWADIAACLEILRGFARLVSRVPRAYDAADRAVPVASSGDPYRGVVDTSALQTHALARVREISEIERVRAANLRLRKIQSTVGSIALIVAFIALRLLIG